MSGGTGWLRIHVWTAERTAVFSFSFNMPKKSDAANLPCICKSLLSIGQSSQTHRAFLQSYVRVPVPFHVLHADLRRSFMKGYHSPSPIFRLYKSIYEDAQNFFQKKEETYASSFCFFSLLSSVDLSSVPYRQCQYDKPVVLYLAQQTIVSYPVSPLSSPVGGQSLSVLSRIIGFRYVPVYPCLDHSLCVPV